MAGLVKWMDQRFYPSQGDNWDDEVFRQRILARLRRDALVLDLGAGAGILPQMDFKGSALKVCGIDLEPRVRTNPLLDEGRQAAADQIPYENDTFDMVFSNNVLEHLASPVAVFREVHRVMKPGGFFLFKTPNVWHYVPIIARLTPQKFHHRIVGGRGRESEDVFPKFYRANSRDAVVRLADSAGFDVVSIERLEGRPEYLRMFGITYLAGLAYERLVNSVEAFAPLRVILIGQLQKTVFSSC
jgi:SAM-dependent methyltransferase